MARRGPSALGRHTGHGEGTIGHGKGAPATGDGRQSDLQAPAMEVLEVGDDSDMWVPHVSGVGRVQVEGEGRGTTGISCEGACVAMYVACALVLHQRKGYI
jgi:hypothetical protein